MQFILDPGHGSIDPQGQYTTAPAKMVEWPGKDLHLNRPFFYEGYFNREMEMLIAEGLSAWGHSVKSTLDTQRWVDLPLKYRTKKANALAKEYDGHTALISLHANAGRGKGLELFTFFGQSNADILATLIFVEHKRLCSYFMDFRSDLRDGDPDKEANFWMLRKTSMPAVLVEFGFMDTWSDVEYMMSTECKQLMANAVVNACRRYSDHLQNGDV